MTRACGMLEPVGRVHACIAAHRIARSRPRLEPALSGSLSLACPSGPHFAVPMAILNLYFMQGSIKECLAASEQDRELLCTLQPSRIVTMLLSMLTSAALFRYPAAPCV